MNIQEKKDKAIELAFAHHAKIQKMLADDAAGVECDDDAQNDELLEDWHELHTAIVDAGGPDLQLDFGMVAVFGQTTTEEFKQIVDEFVSHEL